MVFVFGSGTFASATVLAVFMGGLALGAFVAGKFADRMRRPFLVYGILEAIIGLWALAAPFLFNAALPIYKAVWLVFHLSTLPFSILRFCVVALILLVPTACMGATLPLLSRYITTSLSLVGKRVGTLYAINTIGAVFGAIAGGFFLIPNFGLSASTCSAAAANIALAISVVILNRFWGPMPEAVQIKNENDETPANKSSLSRPALITLIAFGISGAIAMIYEVAWTRALLLLIGSTTYAFSIMLSTFLIGIFIGSLVAARIADKLKDAVFWFSIMQLLLGVCGFFSIVLFRFLPYINIVANNQVLGNQDIGMCLRFLFAGAVLMPITLFLGAIFPLAVKACTPELERLGNSVATLYSANTLGAILGSFAAGFIIIPNIGGEQTLVCCASANVILGAVMIILCCQGMKALKIASGILALFLFVFACTQPQIWDLHSVLANQKIRRGLYFRDTEIKPFQEWLKLVDESFDILSWKDGICANVAVVQFKSRQVSLFTNGHIDASTGITDMATQMLLPIIPLILRPGAQDVADVGWGSGCTMGYALLFPIRKMVCAEIEPAVVATSPYFHRVNLKPENDSRLRLEINDGRNYLLSTDEKFDIITSEPSNPWQAGVCNLYTQEYFQTCHDRLKPGGIFSMWWQYNEVTPENLCCVFAALKKVYKHLVVFQTFPGDITACASDEPIKIKLDDVKNALEIKNLRYYLHEYTAITEPEDFPLTVCITDEEIDKLIKGLEPNTDDRNRIEFEVARTYEHKNYTVENNKWLLKHSGNVWDTVDWGKWNKNDKALKMAQIAERAFMHNNLLAQRWADESYRVNPNSYALCVMALFQAQKLGDFEKSSKLADKAVKEFPDEVSPRCVQGLVYLLGGAPLKARKAFEAALVHDPQNQTYKFRLAQTYLPMLTDWYQIANINLEDDGKADSDPKKALALISPCLNDSKFLQQNPEAIATAAAANFELGMREQGYRLMQSYLRIRQDDILGFKYLLDFYKYSGDSTGIKFCSDKLLELGKARAEKLCKSANLLLSNKEEKYAAAILGRALTADPSSSEARKLLVKLAQTNKDAELEMKKLSSSSFEDLQAYKELIQNKNRNSKNTAQ